MAFSTTAVCALFPLMLPLTAILKGILLPTSSKIHHSKGLHVRHASSKLGRTLDIIHTVQITSVQYICASAWTLFANRNRVLTRAHARVHALLIFTLLQMPWNFVWEHGESVMNLIATQTHSNSRRSLKESFPQVSIWIKKNHTRSTLQRTYSSCLKGSEINSTCPCACTQQCHSTTCEHM